MITVCIVIFALIIVSSVIWRYLHRKRKVHEFHASVGKEVVDKTSVRCYSVNVCCSALDEIIKTIMAGDKIQICQKQRLFAAEYDKFEHFLCTVKDAEVRDDIYPKYLWEATLKIAEAGRKMVVNPEFDCNAPEIRDLGFLTRNLPCDTNMELAEMAKICSSNEERMSETIRKYRNRMGSKDYEEDSQKYNFLSFLSYIHSFMMTLDSLTEPYAEA